MKRKSILFDYTYSTVSDYKLVKKIDLWLNEHLGKPGTQAGRRWFWFTSHKWKPLSDGTRPIRCAVFSFYIRDPKDATYFQLIWGGKTEVTDDN